RKKNFWTHGWWSWAGVPRLTATNIQTICLGVASDKNSVVAHAPMTPVHLSDFDRYRVEQPKKELLDPWVVVMGGCATPNGHEYPNYMPWSRFGQKSSRGTRAHDPGTPIRF